MDDMNLGGGLKLLNSDTLKLKSKSEMVYFFYFIDIYNK